jgi:hypothetical protein
MMQNKKLFVVFGILVLAVGGAAFLAGRMLNGSVGPLGLLRLGGNGDMIAVEVNVIPAEELPKTQPEITGRFVERKDNTIVIQPVSLTAGGGGIVSAEGGGEVTAGSDSGPKVEVVVTNETIIYLDTTHPAGPPSGDEDTVQQTVEESTLDDLTSQSMVRVWGRKSGDRIIADVLFYGNPVMFKRP